MSNGKESNVLDLLDGARKSEELGRNISTATLLWAVSSVAADLLRWRGWLSTYEDALPAVVLVTWLGSEIWARLPSRVPIAVCGRCGRASVLPRRPLRRLWPWKQCTYCGGPLNFSCPEGHLLSVFADEPLAMSLQTREHGKQHEVVSIWCSRCGRPARKLSDEEFRKHQDLLTEHVPENISDGEVANWIRSMAEGRSFSGPVEAALPKPLSWSTRRVVLDDDV